jgi:ABC-2 type transport system ATP-binding protein
MITAPLQRAVSSGEGHGQELVAEGYRLCKTFAGGVVAVSDLNVRVPRGAIYGLMGRNGAGKTTTLRLLMGLLRPDSGSAKVFGRELWTAPRAIRSRVVYVPQAAHLPGWMTLQDLSRFLARHYAAWDWGVKEQLQRRWELPEAIPLALLSGGQQRLVALLAALAARPEVLVLDEPAAGLDPITRRDLLRSLVESVTQNEKCTVLFSTHQIGDLERVADHIGIMHRGRLVTSSPLDRLLADTKRVQVVFDRAAPPVDFAVPGALRTDVRGPVVNALVRLVAETQLEAIRRLPGVRVQVFDVGLEELFIELFQPSSEAEGSWHL